MDRYLKFLRKLTGTEREKVLLIWQKIEENNLKFLTVKKLKGFKNLYRIRSGKIRIVFEKRDKENIVINIDFRKDAYKGLGSLEK